MHADRLPWVFGPWLLRAALLLGLGACANQAEQAAIASDVQRRIAAHPERYINGDARAVLISRDGAAHGLIWGTYHVGYDETTIPPAAIRDTLEHAKDLTVEAVIDDRSAAQLQHLFAPCRTAAREHSDAALAALDPQTRTSLEQVGLPASNLKELSLLGLGYAVAQASPSLSRSGLPSGGSPDVVLTKMARNSGIPLHALERPEAQVAAFCGDPNGQVAALDLRLTLRRRGEREELDRFLRDSYARGAIASAMAAAFWKADPADEDAIDENWRRLFGRRNAVMARRIDAVLGTPGFHFVAVGAGHLLGTDGLVAVLTRDGWTVTPCPGDRCPSS